MKNSSDHINDNNLIIDLEMSVVTVLDVWNSNINHRKRLTLVKVSCLSTSGSSAVDSMLQPQPANFLQELPDIVET